MTLEEFDRCLAAQREDCHLEFKEAKNQIDFTKLLKYCVAIANEGGGKLILGASDKLPRRVVGTRAFMNDAGVVSRILEKLRIRINLETLQHPDGRVIIFHIPSRPMGSAYQLEGAFWMRSGEELVPMTEDQLRTIFDEGKPDYLSEISISGVNPSDVVQLLDTQSYFDLLKQSYPSTREEVLDRLEREKLIVREANKFAVLRLGAVLLAKNLSDFDGLSRKATRLVVYDGISKLQTRLDKPGTKGYAVGFSGLLEFINSQAQPNEVIGDALRREVKMFPKIAIRELVANALIHQDFEQSGSRVMVELYSDRIEISNPGLPFIPPERFIDEYQSRNDRLADLMRRMGACEEKGSGIDKVVNSAEFYQLPAPDFRTGERRTTAILFAQRPFEEMDRDDRVRACYQHCCLRYVTHQRMTNHSLRSRFALPDSRSDVVSRIIRDVLEERMIKLEDPNNSSKRYAKYVPFWA